MSIAKLEHLTAGYGRDTVIEDITFEIHAGQLVGILGINGSGKSTLAKTVCNTLPHTGTVRIQNRILENQKEKQTARMVSYIPQHSGVAIDIPVLDVVMMGFNPWLKLLERPDKKMVEKAKAVLEEVGLSEKIYANYAELSEGQKQLVIFARALVSEAQLLLMDEPESALDFGVRYKAMQLVRKWIRSGDRAGLVILHDIALALNSCDQLVLLDSKRVASVIDTKNESAESIEAKLQKIYGNLALKKVRTSAGKERFAVLYEGE